MKNLMIIAFFVAFMAFGVQSATACGMPMTYFFLFEDQVYQAVATSDRPAQVKILGPMDRNRAQATLSGTFSLFRDKDGLKVRLVASNGSRAINLVGSPAAVYRCLDSPSVVTWDNEAMTESMRYKIDKVIAAAEEAAKKPQTVGVKVKVILYPEAAMNFAQFGVELNGDILTMADGATVDLFSQGENARVELRANEDGKIVARVYEKNGDVLEYLIFRGRFDTAPKKLP